MSTSTIQLKRSSTPGAIPSAGGLALGEIALNIVDGKIYYKNLGGSVVSLFPDKASQAKAEAAVDDTDFMTALKTKQQQDVRVAQEIIDVGKYCNRNGVDCTAGLLQAIADWQGTADNAQYAGNNTKVLHFPPGLYYAPGVEIQTKGTGGTITGAGRTSRLDGIKITFKNRDCAAWGLSLTGAGDFGFKWTASARRYGVFDNLHARERDIGGLYEGGALDQITNSLFEKNFDNFRFTGTLGVQLTNVEWNGPTNDNVQFFPASTEHLGEVKFSNCRALGHARYGIYLYANSSATPTPTALVECYFTGLTSCVGLYTRTNPIKSITSIGGGLVQVETVNDHQMVKGIGTFQVSGTANYNGTTYYARDVLGPKIFTMAAASAVNEVGTAMAPVGTLALPAWDLYIDSEANSPNHQINDMWFGGGNFNWTYIGKCFNINFVNTRLKNQIWMESGSRVFYVRNRRGRNEEPFADTKVGGPGSITGWGEFAYTDGNTSTPGGGGVEMAAPYTDAGLLPGNIPALNTVTVREDRVLLGINNKDMVDIRNDKDTNIGSVNIGGSSAAASVRIRQVANSVVDGVSIPTNYIDIVGALAGGGPVINTAGTDPNISLSLMSKGTGNISLNPGGARQLLIAYLASAVNYVQVNGAIANSTAGPIILATGSDPTVNLTLNTKATAAAAGTISLNTGNVRQVMVNHVTTAVNYTSLSGAITANGPIYGVAGADTNIDLNLNSKGTGVISLNPGAVRQAAVLRTASAVNYVTLTGAITTDSPVIGTAGSDTNIPLALSTAGAGSLLLSPGAVRQAEVIHTPSAVNYLTLTGATTGGGPTLGANGTDTNIPLNLNTKGTGVISLKVGSVEQVRIRNNASALNYVTMYGGSAGLAATITVDGEATAALNIQTKGSANLSFNPGAVRQMVVSPTTSAVNYLQATGAIAGSGPVITTAGTEANVALNLRTKGTAAITLAPGSVRQVSISHVASAVNYLNLYGATTGNGPTIALAGTDTNIDLNMASKGTGVIALLANGAKQFQTGAVATAVNYVTASGSVTTGPVVIGAGGSDANIDLQLLPKGTGRLRYSTPIAKAAEVFTKYVFVNDVTGTPYKVMVCE